MPDDFQPILKPDGWTDAIEACYQADLTKWAADSAINQGYVLALKDPVYGRALYMKFVIGDSQ